VELVQIPFQIIGSIGLLLYGMKLMSDGVQKSAGDSLQRVLKLMTGNRLLSVLTGVFVTMIIQSSGATTVMVVSFVNAGLLTLVQAIGVIFGANIGTTVTAWIVAVFGDMHMAAYAIPVFGIGFFITFIKKLRREGLGIALMGFGLLFFGLDRLSSIISLDASNLQFLTKINGTGIVQILTGVAIGIGLTVLLHSSSASTAIVLTMASAGVIKWELSAAIILGSNIGSTVDSVVAAAGTRVNARRAAFIHVMFNITGTLLAVLLFRPLLTAVDMLVPGSVENNIKLHVAMLHTVFNSGVTLLYLPFIPRLADIAERIIKPSKSEIRDVYVLDFPQITGKEHASAFVFRAEKEIAAMSELVIAMFDDIQVTLLGSDEASMQEPLARMEHNEQYANQMYEQLTKYLLKCEQLPVSRTQLNNISIMLQIVDELEGMANDCHVLCARIQKSIAKKMVFLQEDLDGLVPYMELTKQFITFVHINVNKHLNAEKLSFAKEMQEQIDSYRKELKKTARKRLESGADVKSELLYIDMIRHIEKLGDRSFAISEALTLTK